jgi:hypothetical protein
MLNFYLNIHKYNVGKDYKSSKDLNDLYEYKKNVLTSNGFGHLVESLPNSSAKFTLTKYDEDGYEDAVDVDDVYPVGLEEERKEILNRAGNLEYIANVHTTFEHCRTKCKVLDQRLRNINLYPKENQMCVTDCMNVKTELYNPKKPGQNEEKTFVWLS